MIVISARRPAAIVIALGSIAVLLLTAAQVRGTTLVILVEQKAVTFAADSRYVSVERGEIARRCKIVQGAGCFFGMTGLTFGPSYNATDLGRKACARASTSPRAKLSAFLDLVKEPLTVSLREVDANPEYAARLRTQPTLLEAAFIGPEKN